MRRSVLLAVAALSGGLALGGCAATPTFASTATPVSSATVDGADATTLDGAKALAQEELNRYGAGDAGGAWDLLDQTSQTAVSRADYIAVHDACPLRALSYTIKSARMETPTQAVITVAYMGTSQAYKVNYEGGQWRWQMQPSDAANYKNGAQADIARLKKLGLCG
jgi:hypothetical protein